MSTTVQNRPDRPGVATLEAGTGPTGDDGGALAPGASGRRAAFAEWGGLVVAFTARVVLAVIVCLLLWAALPAIWGWWPTTVVSGSMAPRIEVGDVVVSMPVDPNTLEVGQVLLVDDPDRAGTLRLHRLDAITDEGLLRLRGDANARADSSLVEPAAVRGVGVLLVPSIGLPVAWHGDQRLLGLVGLGAAVAALVGLTRLAPWLDPDEVDPLGVGRHRASPRGAGSCDQRGRSRRGRLAGLVVAVTAGAMVLFAVVGSTHASFSATTGTGASVLATGSFPCLDRPVAAGAHVAYQFNDGVGSVARDSSGNGRDGTMTTGASIRSGTCEAAAGPYLQLDGVSGQVTSSERLRAPTVFTVETWFRTTTTTGGKLIGFGNSQAGASTQYDRHLYLTDRGTLVFGVYSGQTYTMTSPASYNDGSWHLATVTMDASGMVLYVDGAQVAASTQSAAENVVGWWRIGYDTLGGSWPSVPTTAHYRGDLENTTVYDVALSAADVAAHAAAGR